MRANIKAEVNPIVGTEKQSEELVHYLLSEFEEQPEKIWDTNIFGKSLNELVREELSHKLSRMPDDARGKIRETLEKIINESAGGLNLHHPVSVRAGIHWMPAFCHILVCQMSRTHEIWISVACFTTNF